VSSNGCVGVASAVTYAVHAAIPQNAQCAALRAPVRLAHDGGWRTVKPGGSLSCKWSSASPDVKR